MRIRVKNNAGALYCDECIRKKYWIYNQEYYLLLVKLEGVELEVLYPYNGRVACMYDPNYMYMSKVGHKVVGIDLELQFCDVVDRTNENELHDIHEQPFKGLLSYSEWMDLAKQIIGKDEYFERKSFKKIES